jgi:hypothetical protein
MALTFSLIDTWDDGKRIHVSGTIAASGNYVTMWHGQPYPPCDEPGLCPAQ